MAPVVDDIVPEITLYRNIAPTRHAALHMGEEVVVPGAAVAAYTGREGMPLLVAPFGNDAPLHREAVERPGGGQGLGGAPTARAMVNDEVVLSEARKLSERNSPELFPARIRRKRMITSCVARPRRRPRCSRSS